MGRIEIEAMPYNEEGVLNLLISAWSFGYSGRVEIYIKPEQLTEYGIKLLGFPAELTHKVPFEYGDGTREWPYHLLLQAEVIDKSGHCALLVRMQSFAGMPEYAKAEFYIPSEAADINILGETLTSWVKCPENTFVWKTRA